MQTQYPTGTLPAQGLRFLRRNGVFAWADPVIVGTESPDFLDCTDLSDDEFERVVRETEAA